MISVRNCAVSLNILYTCIVSRPNIFDIYAQLFECWNFLNNIISDYLARFRVSIEYRFFVTWYKYGILSAIVLNWQSEHYTSSTLAANTFPEMLLHDTENVSVQETDG